MVGGLAAGRGTRVFLAQHRQLAAGEPELPIGQTHVVDHSEAVRPELAGLG